MILVADLPRLDRVEHWNVPCEGRMGSTSIIGAIGSMPPAMPAAELSSLDGEVRNQWRLAGEPDATFFDPASGLVHVAIAHPGVVQSVDPQTGRSTELSTGAGAKTTALVPDGLYAFSPAHRATLLLAS